jgi:isopenicillin N synthase-like dioxygenase
VDIPVIDLAAGSAVADIGEACRTVGFFTVTNHGVPTVLQAALEALSRDFFAQDVPTKMRLRMSRAGQALRGYFPVGGELTSGRPDLKEGLYFGKETPPGRPMHGPNLFPSEIFKKVVLTYMDEMTDLGHRLMSLIAQSLGRPADHFRSRYTKDPFTLFRVFNYPPGDGTDWGVGEHTDYGLLTILKQQTAGLQVRIDDWIDVPVEENTFVCNIGDMLDRLTGGEYRSTPHRVVGARDRDRLSWPFFFDPGFDVPFSAIGLTRETWDGVSPYAFDGTYGEWLVAKVRKVFPDLMG